MHIGEAAQIGQVRTSLRQSSDPRAERTRANLFAAAARLSSSDAPVTVSALVREAGVSRAVFYTHFADLGDLALRMQEPHFATIAAAASAGRADDPEGAMLRSQRELVEHIETHRSLYIAALQLPGHAVANRMADAMRAPIEAHVLAVGAPSGVRADIAARYIAAAAAQLVEQWLLGAFEADSETLAQHLFALMPAWMHEHRTAPTQQSAN